MINYCVPTTYYCHESVKLKTLCLHILHINGQVSFVHGVEEPIVLTTWLDHKLLHPYIVFLHLSLLGVRLSTIKVLDDIILDY